ncbi:hypothetical protein V6N13_109124 [Hibiscus sabdariffa]
MMKVNSVKGMMKVVILVRELGFSKIVVEGDSLTVIKKLYLVVADTSTIGPMIYDIRVVAQGFVHVSYSFVRRQANIVPHALASKGNLFVTRWSGLEAPPITTLTAENDRVVFDHLE